MAVPGYEGERVSGQGDHAVHRAAAVADPVFAAQRDGNRAVGGVLEGRAHLAGVERVDPVVIF